jgi:hypothetical protein
MNRIRRALILRVSLPLLVAMPLRAQANTDSIHHRNECRLARQVAMNGHPANKFEWALDVLPTCGVEGGEALAQLIGSSQITDWNLLVDAAGSLHDAAVYRAALGLATNASAPPVNRVQAMRILARLAEPGDVTPYADLVAPGRISSTVVTDQTYFDGTPMPADWKSTASVALRQAETSTTSAEVRTAASRVAGLLQAIARIDRLCPRGTSREECTRRRTTMP